jgi:dinuclear metal center YbgI/SA1388 family protein
MKYSDISEALWQVAPHSLALPEDPVGEMIEPADFEISRISVCLDCTIAVAHAAAQRGAQLIVAHHPLLFHPIKAIRRREPIGAVVAFLTEHGIGLWATHTNWDAATGGINDTLAHALGLTDITAISGGGEAYLGRIGNLSAELPASALLHHVEERLACTGSSALRAIQPHEDFLIRRVGVCGGAGAMLVPDAIGMGAHAFVTADVRHHEFIDAQARGLLLIDAGHEATEAPGMRGLADRLSGLHPELTVEFITNDGRV